VHFKSFLKLLVGVQQFTYISLEKFSNEKQYQNWLFLTATKMFIFIKKSFPEDGISSPSKL